MVRRVNYNNRISNADKRYDSVALERMSANIPELKSSLIKNLIAAELILDGQFYVDSTTDSQYFEYTRDHKHNRDCLNIRDALKVVFAERHEGLFARYEPMERGRFKVTLSRRLDTIETHNVLRHVNNLIIGYIRKKEEEKQGKSPKNKKHRKKR